MKKLLSILLAAALVLTAPAAALAADDTGLVTDAFTYDYSDEWGNACSYRVPKIAREGAGIQAVNDAIWQELYEDLLCGEYGPMTAIQEGWMPEPYQISYQWTLNGDVLSLVTVADYDADYRGFTVYNVSLSTGRRITDGELLGVAGLTQEDFYAAAGQVLSAAFEENCSSFPEDEMKAEQRASNNSDANIRAVKPYLGASGDLCMIGTVYSLAGAGQYDYELTVLSRDQLPVQDFTSAGLPEQAPVDERLMYFIDHCNDEYLTRADIAGFDGQMCVYARNSIYARLGWIFESAQLQAFFSRFDWYAPTLDPAQFTADMLNDCQRANVDLVLNYEAEMGY